jgi:hypothetical protein
VVVFPPALDRLIEAVAGPGGQAAYNAALVALLAELLPPAEECALAAIAGATGGPLGLCPRFCGENESEPAATP